MKRKIPLAKHFRTRLNKRHEYLKFGNGKAPGQENTWVTCQTQMHKGAPASPSRAYFFFLRVGRTGGTAGRIRATFLLLSLNHSLPERGGFQILPFCWHPNLLLHSWTDSERTIPSASVQGKANLRPNMRHPLKQQFELVLLRARCFNLKNKEARYFLIVSCWTRGEWEPKPQTAIFYQICLCSNIFLALFSSSEQLLIWTHDALLMINTTQDIGVGQGKT